MKKITFYGYVENCPCTFCSELKAIMLREEDYHINSFKIEDDEQVSVPKEETVTQKHTEESK